MSSIANYFFLKQLQWRHRASTSIKESYICWRINKCYTGKQTQISTGSLVLSVYKQIEHCIALNQPKRWKFRFFNHSGVKSSQSSGNNVRKCCYHHNSFSNISSTFPNDALQYKSYVINWENASLGDNGY